jgi:hypothetical protein
MQRLRCELNVESARCQMKPYMKGDKFRPISELPEFRGLTKPEAMPTGHYVSGENGRAYVPTEPSPTYNSMMGVGGFVQLLNDGIDWANTTRQDAATSEVIEEAKHQLPFGEPYTVVVNNPGSADMDAVIFRGENALVVSSTDEITREYSIRGQNINGSEPLEVAYQGPSGNIDFAPVTGSRQPQPVPAANNSIDREPRDIVPIRNGDPRELPADAGLDRDHPNFIDPHGLA